MVTKGALSPPPLLETEIAPREVSGNGVFVVLVIFMSFVVFVVFVIAYEDFEISSFLGTISLPILCEYEGKALLEAPLEPISMLIRCK